MTKINLIHTELRQETSKVKSSDVHIAQKIREVKDMTMLRQKKKNTTSVRVPYVLLLQHYSMSIERRIERKRRYI